jgi:Xaa-Pro dipeptidase
MAFSATERARREKAIRGVIEAKGLKALILIGDTNVGSEYLGDFRYYVDNRIIAGQQVAMLFPQAEPVLFSGTAIQQQAASRRSSVKDCRVSDDLLADTVGLLKERTIMTGKVGISFAMLSVPWFNYLKKELPEIEWVETHQEIFNVRIHHGPEEAELFRKCGIIGAGEFEAAAKMIKPGVTEYEIAAAIEEHGRVRGAEQHFTLVGSGRYTPGDGNGLPLPYSPSQRRVEAGESVVMEITPRVEGYWTQIVRTVNVARPNAELEKLYGVSRDAIRKGLEVFKPGKTIRDVVLAMDAYVKECGYLFRPPTGHICGVDLIEGRVSPQNTRVLESGTAVIIHPTIATPDGKNTFFWGETYLVTDAGHERLNPVTDELLTVGM